MDDFDRITRRRLLGMAGITLASLSLPRLGFPPMNTLATTLPRNRRGRVTSSASTRHAS